MRFYFFLINLAIGVLLSDSLQAQTISVGPDIVVPSCQSCTTLVATTNSPSVGTNNYLVNQINYTPFAFTGGTVVPLNIDDRWSDVIQMPFDFCFYGNTYNQCVISSNGQIGFNLFNANTFNPWSFNAVAPLPNAAFAAAHNSIMSPYHDILPTALGIINYQTIGTAPNRIWVVSWNQSPMFSCTNLLSTQQIALYEMTNVIETYIANKPLCANWNQGMGIHGIQNVGGTIAHIVPGRNLPTQWTATNDAWQFTPTGGGGGGNQAGVTVDWYQVVNGVDSLLASNTDSITVCPDVTTRFKAKATFFLCGGVDTASDEILVIKQDSVSLNLVSMTEPKCFNGNDGSFTVSANGGGGSYIYTYNGLPMNGPTQTGLTAGVYTVVATDVHNCTSSIEIVVTEPTEVQLGIEEYGDVLCKYHNSGFVRLTASGGTPSYLYWMNNNAAMQSPLMEYLPAGDYRFYTSDSHGCLDSLDFTISQPDSLLSVTVEAHQASCINLKDGRIESFASGGVSPYYYEWNTRPPQYMPEATQLETGVYLVVVKDANDCVTATQIAVEQELCCKIFLPDAFTPNNDAMNDIYRILQYGGGVILGEFRIYNRWGQEVFASREFESGWDGSFKGELQPSDTYHYVVVYQCNDRGTISQKIAKGSFLLIR